MEIIIQKAMGNHDIAARIYNLLDNWNRKTQFLSPELIKTTIALLNQKQTTITKTGYLIFKKLNFNDWVKSITEGKPLSDLVATFNRQLLAQKRAFQ
jgi:hypothetical protein